MRKVVKILKQQSVREQLLAQGAEPVGDTPEEFSRFTQAEISKWAKIINNFWRQGGLKNHLPSSNPCFEEVNLCAHPN